MILPSVEVIRPNFTLVHLRSIQIWFSYETPIAFEYKGTSCIRKNDWNVTTGKHLNFLDRDKSIRISGTEFEKKLYEITSKF